MDEPVVSFYLVHSNAGDPRCPPAKSNALKKAPVNGLSLNKDAESLPWKITFDRSSTPQTLTRLVVFGSHPKCTIVLSGPNISPIHCIVYAQLNSGYRMMVIEDCSGTGTSFFDDGSARAGIRTRIMHDRLYAEGLRTIDIGPYQFRIEPPSLEAEEIELGRWFFEHEPQPVTEPMLRAQLMRKKPEFQELDEVGEGGNGKIYRFVEKRTGLLFCVKKQSEYLNSNAQKECMWLKHLQSPLLAQYIHSRSVVRESVLEWWTYMPLYRGNLTTMMPQSLEVLESVWLQMLKAVSFVHAKGALHQDIKPDNFFLLKKRPIEIVLGDFGHTISMQDHGLLMSDCGTEGFAAPERLLQRHTTALDVYSLGVSFFVMLEWEKLRHGDWKNCLKKVAEQPPSNYGGLIMRMIARNPEERPTLQQCMEVVRGKHYEWGKPSPTLPQMVQARRPNYGHNARPNPQVVLDNKGAERVQVGHLQRGRSPEKIDASPFVAALSVKKRNHQPIRNTTYHNIFPYRGTNTRTYRPVPAVNAPSINTDKLKRGPNQAAKAITRPDIFADLETKPKAATTAPVAHRREYKENATIHNNIFGHLDTKTKSIPPSVVHRREHNEDVLRSRALQPQNTNRIGRSRANNVGKRIGTRDQLRRGPIRKANIERAFKMGQKLTTLRNTTTNMAKCLWYLGAGAVTSTCVIASLGVDAFKLFKDVDQATQAINHMEPEASIKIGDARRLAAGMKSTGLKFVTPTEYEMERMASSQLKAASTRLKRLEPIRENEPACTTRRCGTAQ